MAQTFTAYQAFQIYEFQTCLYHMALDARSSQLANAANNNSTLAKNL